MVVNTTLSQGQVVQRYISLAHHHTCGVTWVFYPFIYQVTQGYIALDTYHINGITIASTEIFIRQKLPLNIFLQLHT